MSLFIAVIINRRIDTFREDITNINDYIIILGSLPTQIGNLTNLTGFFIQNNFIIGKDYIIDTFILF